MHAKTTGTQFIKSPRSQIGIARGQTIIQQMYKQHIAIDRQAQREMLTGGTPIAVLDDIHARLVDGQYNLLAAFLTAASTPARVANRLAQ